MSTLWNRSVSESNVRLRMKAMGLPNAALYAIGCATHARDAVAACNQGSFHPHFVHASSLLDQFWLEYPRSIDSRRLAELDKLLFENLLDQSECESAEDVWLDAMSYAFSCAALTEFSEAAEIRAYNAIGQSYLFVYTYHHELERIHSSEEEIAAVEAASEYCMREIKFQISLLSAVEHWYTSLPPPYAELLRMIQKGDVR